MLHTEPDEEGRHRERAQDLGRATCCGAQDAGRRHLYGAPRCPTAKNSMTTLVFISVRLAGVRGSSRRTSRSRSTARSLRTRSSSYKSMPRALPARRYRLLVGREPDGVRLGRHRATGLLPAVSWPAWWRRIRASRIRSPPQPTRSIAAGVHRGRSTTSPASSFPKAAKDVAVTRSSPPTCSRPRATSSSAPRMPGTCCRC